MAAKIEAGEPLTRSEIEAGLRVLAERVALENLSPGAMCYRQTFGAQACFFCPKCGEKSFLERRLAEEIEEAAVITRDLKILDARIDLSSCCLHCSSGVASSIQTPNFKFSFRLAGDFEDRKIFITNWDLRLLRQFFSGSDRISVGHPLAKTIALVRQSRNSFVATSDIIEISEKPSEDSLRDLEVYLTDGERAYMADPKMPSIVESYALLLVRMHRFENAIKVFQHLAELEPDCQDFRYLYGNVLFRLGRHSEALREWNFILELVDPNSIWAEKTREKIFRLGSTQLSPHATNIPS